MKKSNLLLTVLFIFGSCECLEDPLVEVLGNPCYINEKQEVIELADNSSEYEQLNYGICETGKTDRDKDGNLICIGYMSPTQEMCNGIDDDCNGIIDDNSYGQPLSISYYNSENTCKKIGVCRYTEQECINGEWICDYPLSYGREQCDNKDNDCDGETDEDTYDEPIFDDSERYVYTADIDTINIGECRAGYKECVDGIVSIRNMRTPVPEICGNDDDDDCDGLTDEREGDVVRSDFALIIDFSGSMRSIIEIVSDTLCSWSSQGVLQNSRFAVIAIGYSNGTDSRQMKVLADFTDSGTACNVIRENNLLQFSGGTELQLNATYNANDPTAASGYVNWISDRRRVLIFSDEKMQQDFRRTVEDAIEVVVQQCTDIGYTIGAFINYNVDDQTLWVDLTQRCNGFLDYLSPNSQQMIDTLNYWVGTDC